MTFFLLLHCVVYDDFIVHLTFGDDKFRPYLIPPQESAFANKLNLFVQLGNEHLVLIFQMLLLTFLCLSKVRVLQNVLFGIESVCKLHSEGVSSLMLYYSLC